MERSMSGGRIAFERCWPSSDSNWSAGRTSQRKRASPSPAFQKRCAVPGATRATSPGRATISFSPIFRTSVPSSTFESRLRPSPPGRHRPG